MSSKKVTSLGLAQATAEKLTAAGLHSLKDILSKSPMELMVILNSSYPKVMAMLEICFRNAMPFNVSTSLQLLEVQYAENTLEKKTNLFAELVFDNNVLHNGTICELCGPPGSGKTQFSFQLCVQLYLNNFNDRKNFTVFYIDTENTFSAQRLYEIAEKRFPDINDKPDRLSLMLSSVHVYKIITCEELIRALDQIEYEIVMKDTRLLVIDSIALIVRRSFPDNNPKTLKDRGMFLANISSRLKELSHFLDVSILMTNQITSCFNQQSVQENLEDMEANECANILVQKKPIESNIVAALGSTWSYYVNIRIILQYADDLNRELLIAKSPIAPFKKYYYRITQNGMDFSGFNQIYDGTDPNAQKIKTKPYSHYDYA